jgi:hypothetical protein
MVPAEAGEGLIDADLGPISYLHSRDCVRRFEPFALRGRNLKKDRNGADMDRGRPDSFCNLIA